MKTAIIKTFVTLSLLGFAVSVMALFPKAVQTQVAATTPPISCNQSVVISMSAATTAQLVALVAGQRIHVCGFVLQGAAVTTIKFVSGTGANCGTGTADLTGPFAFNTTPSTVPFGSGVGRAFSTPIGAALCATNSQAAQVQGVASFAQF